MILGSAFDIEILLVGLATGLAYGVLAAGLVLSYRATKTLNLAYGELGAFGAAVLAKLVLDFNWNFFVALALVLLAGGMLGAAIDTVVVRRLQAAPRFVLLVAMIGVAQLFFVFQLLLPGVDHIQRYPSPIPRVIDIGDLVVRSEHFMVLAAVPAIVVGLALLLGRTPWGIAIRAVSQDSDLGELRGMSPHRITTAVWVISGVVATLTVVLISPLRGTIVGVPSAALGPGLLLRALAAALIGRMVSMPVALVGGALIGVTEALIFANISTAGAFDAILFVTVLALVFLRGGGKTLDDETHGGWTSRLTASARSDHATRRSRRATGVALIAAVAFPFVVNSASDTFLFGRVYVFTIIALSVTVLTGWAGQLSLGQFAFVGLGAFVTAALDQRGMPFGVAVAYATVAGGLVAVAIGFPALRVRGVFLAVTTLGFAVAARGWLFGLDFLTQGSTTVSVSRGRLFGFDLSSERAYYFVVLAGCVGAMVVVSRLQHSGVGRQIVAVRDNEQAAASATVSPTATKLTAFAISGALAAFAGALLAGLQVSFSADSFGPEQSLQVVAMTVIGGLGSVPGAILGALYVVGLPSLFGNDKTISLLTSGIGVLALLLYLPGGLIQAVRTIGHGLGLRTDGKESEATEVPPRRVHHTRERRVPLPSTGTAPALLAQDVSLSFGGVKALQTVSIRADHGETIGLIGSNGAGKSTFMNVVSGFLRPDSGSLLISGVDVTDHSAVARSRLGVGRVFQDARLYAGLTVSEAVMVALEAGARSETIPTILAFSSARRAERRKRAEADEYLAFLGLGPFSHRTAAELSTGTRRIVELACLLAQQPRLLLLDEPTAGVAQRETEAFGPLIKRIQSELAATVLLIEHDMPLVMSISDRIYCLASGTCIAEGKPTEVRNDPAVIAAYLGTDERAINRSGTAGTAKRAPNTRRRTAVAAASATKGERP